MSTFLDTFLATWDREAAKTVELLRTLPADQYDFRPDPGARSLGELAWHLAEVDAIMSFGLANGKFEIGAKPPGIQRPKTVEPLANEYARVHIEARERLKFLTEADMEKEVRFFNGKMEQTHELLQDMVLLHLIHHRGQLTVLARLAGATPAGLYGPSREDRQRAAASRS